VPTARPEEKGRRIVGAERTEWIDDCAQRYDAGDSISKIATSVGRSYSFVRRLLSEGGVTMRPRGGNHRRRHGHSSAIPDLRRSGSGVGPVWGEG
jgi:hypothetical protein